MDLRGTNMRRSKLILTTLLIGAAGVAIATNAFAAGSSDQARSNAAPAVSEFTALNGLHHPAPKGLGDAFDSPYYAEHFAPDVSAARLVKGTFDSSDQVWLVPGRGAVCLYVVHGEGGGASCQSDQDAAAGRLVLSVTPPDAKSSFVAGVLPDDVASVDLIGTSARTASVDSNVYVATTDADTASFVDAQGRGQQVTIPRPPAER